MKTWLKNFVKSERGENIIRVSYTLIIIFFVWVLLQPVYSKSIKVNEASVIKDMNYYVITEETLNLYDYNSAELHKYIFSETVCDAVWLNEDDLYIGLTPEQKKLWLKNIEKEIEQEIEVQKEQGTEIIVDKDYTDIKVYHCNDIKRLVFLCRTYQQISKNPVHINIKVF